MGTSLTSLSVVIPCYDEVDRLGATIDEVVEYLRSGDLDAELILVDDGSDDGTFSLMEGRAASVPFVHAIRLPENRGKGAALKRGVKAAKNDVVVFFDADLSYPLTSIDTALIELEKGADLVIGGRDLDLESSKRSYSIGRRLASGAFNLLVDRYLDLGVPDTQCGFKVFKAPVADVLFNHLTIDRFGFDVELLFLAKRWNFTIQRIAVQMTHRSGSSIRVLRDGHRMWMDLRRIRRQARSGQYPLERPASSKGAV